MRTYTVKQVAELSGVSVRTLHHYDEIGLLKPAHIGENRYRYYGPEELLRLQQILIHRELDIPLVEIAAILDRSDFDRVATLQSQRERIKAQAERYRRMLETIDRTIAHLKGESAMSDEDLYSGVVSPEKQAEYEQWLVERYGGDVLERIDTSKKRHAELSADERDRMMSKLAEIEQGLAEGLRRGVPPESESLDPLIRRHHGWVANMWDRPCSMQAYEGLAEMYLAHPDFVARYESIEKGFAQYLAGAVKAWARRQEEG